MHQLLTMDVVELTLLLKSIGFRLESIDYDEFRSWSKKSGSVGNSATTIEPVRAEADHYINVEISCSKSKMVSNLSLKTNETETTATDAPHTTTDSAKSVICTCPKREPRKDSNSFWEVQSSGTFANQRRCSVNALMVSNLFETSKSDEHFDKHFDFQFRTLKRELIMTHRQICYQRCQLNRLH